jgi:hypothetical protein
MVRLARKTQLLALLALAGAPIVNAQDSDLPDLNGSTSEEPTSTSTRASSTRSSASSATSTDDASSTDSSSSATTTGASSTSGSTSSGTVVAGPTDLPTIAGAGIPTMVVPYTANAPFMQHSSLPQGTVFIVVGAVLAFLGACVLFWRALVAWSINRSVKQAAIASIAGDKASKNWGGSSTGYNPVKGNLYKDAGSNMSLEALNAAGKPLKPDSSRKQPPPEGLFFSPTAQHRLSDANLAGSRPVSQVMMGNRSSTYLPAGYYANPGTQAAGGAGSTTIGGNLAPYARNSVYENSPPTTPGHTGNSRNSYLRAGAGSRDGLAGSRNSYLEPQSRPGHTSASYSTQPQSNDGLPGSRAPSAYLEDLFDNHGAGPR